LLETPTSVASSLQLANKLPDPQLEPEEILKNVLVASEEEKLLEMSSPSVASQLQLANKLPDPQFEPKEILKNVLVASKEENLLEMSSSLESTPSKSIPSSPCIENKFPDDGVDNDSEEVLENVELSESFDDKWDMKYLLSWLHRLTPTEKFHLLKFQLELNPEHLEALDNYLSAISSCENDETVSLDDQEEEGEEEGGGSENEEQNDEIPSLMCLPVTKRHN
jgi:hypothetical protein